ncbi:MAG: carbohydrate porin [Verrucomicrobiota bacterium]|jgi:porin
MRTLVVVISFFYLALPSFLTAQNVSTNTPKSFWERDTLTGDWGGTRSGLSDKGFDFGLEYTGEFLANVSGGASRGGLYQHLVKTLLDFDLEKMAGWKGARFHASSLWLWGTRPNDIAGLTGSVYSDPSNISGYDTCRLYELWLEQSFFDGKFSVRAGQIALDEEFICSDYACLFISGTHGWPAFMSTTIPDGGPAYPVAGTGVRLDLKPAEKLELLAALVDGDVRDQASENKYGTHFGFDSNEGVLCIAEMEFRINQKRGDQGLPGTYKLGGWYHTGHFNDLRYDNHGISLEDDGTLSGQASDGIPAPHAGDGGIYFNLDQMLWRKTADLDQGVGIYWRIAPWLLDDRNSLDFYTAGGVVCKGLVPGRDQDVFGAGVSYARVSNSLRGAQSDADHIAAAGSMPNNLKPGPVPDYEMGFEATYQIVLAPWWRLQPDFQYIVHPGGSTALADAIVVGVRTQISF